MRRKNMNLRRLTHIERVRIEKLTRTKRAESTKIADQPLLGGGLTMPATSAQTSGRARRR